MTHHIVGFRKCIPRKVWDAMKVDVSFWVHVWFPDLGIPERFYDSANILAGWHIR